MLASLLSRRRLLRQVLSSLSPSELVAEIRRDVLWRSRDTGKTWFHPRACRIPKSGGGRLLMTLQRITGSDVFHPVHWTESLDDGKTWSEPRPIPGMGRKTHPDGVEEGICDVVPEYHPQTRTVIALGQNVYYDQFGKLTRPSLNRHPVYAVRRRDGSWGPVKTLGFQDPEAGAMYTSGCSQRITLADGDILMPLSLGRLGRTDRSVCSVRCRFDGHDLRIIARGNSHTLAVGRGLVEPSLVRFGSHYLMTIRAEDQHGYVTSSSDGLHWGERKPWAWDDGEPITTSTTQQHWLPHSDGLFLTYTRKDASNANVFRWRTPIYMAQVDEKRLCLRRSSEKVVFPLVGDGVNDPKNVPLHGNFHTTAISREVSIVTSCDLLVKDFSGDTMLARIRWARPNRDIEE